MPTNTKYPKYLKAPERGLHIAILGPHQCEILRLLKTESGINIGMMLSETPHVTTTFLEDAGLRESDLDEHLKTFNQIKTEINRR